ncbi:MAG: UbiA family prenyltransferase [Deltaproteobacteria bacterium]|nr:UbiA family prenyltransferase [Deltaproteobacteria bacterium]
MGGGRRFLARIKLPIMLAKMPLCLLIGFSALFGFFLADSAISLRAFLTGAGLFFLAAGSATLNSIQEIHLDTRFERTRNRPLPRGTVSLLYASIQATLFYGVGWVILSSVAENSFPLGVTLLALLLYNGIYTPLKKKTVLAIIPGAVCGALVPYIGWLIGGGGKTAFESLLLVALMVLWQIPHFWLVLLRYRSDYKKDIIPTLFLYLKESSIRRLFIPWIGGLVFVMALFSTLPLINGTPIRILIVFNALVLMIWFLLSFSMVRRVNYDQLFSVLNGTLFFHMTIITLGNIWL